MEYIFQGLMLCCHGLSILITVRSPGTGTSYLSFVFTAPSLTLLCPPQSLLLVRIGKRFVLLNVSSLTREYAATIGSMPTGWRVLLVELDAWRWLSINVTSLA